MSENQRIYIVGGSKGGVGKSMVSMALVDYLREAMINWQKDSLELLADYLQAVPDGVVHVLRNAYFGQDRKYERYNNSGVRKAVEGKGGKSLTFPDVADRVAEQLYSARMPIEVAAREMSIGNRAEMSRWRKKVGTVLSEVVDG